MGGSSSALRSGLRAALRPRPKESCPRRVPKRRLRWLLRSLPTPPPARPRSWPPELPALPPPPATVSDLWKGSVASSIGLNGCAEPMCCSLVRQRSTAALQHRSARCSTAQPGGTAATRPPSASDRRALASYQLPRRGQALGLPSSVTWTLPVSPFVACRTAGGHNQWISAVAVRSARRV